MKTLYKVLLFILLPVGLTSFGEINLKNAINNMHLTLSIQALPQIIVNPFFILSVACIIVGGVLWLVGMSKFELSFMYPFLTLNYLFIIVGSIAYLKETVSIHTYIAVFLIALGLILISRSKYSETTTL